MQYDLELVLVKNSHEFVDEYLKRPEFVELMRRLGALGDGNKDPSKSDMLFVSRPFLFPIPFFSVLRFLVSIIQLFCCWESCQLQKLTTNNSF